MIQDGSQHFSIVGLTKVILVIYGITEFLELRKNG